MRFYRDIAWDTVCWSVCRVRTVRRGSQGAAGVAAAVPRVAPVQRAASGERAALTGGDSLGARNGGGAISGRRLVFVVIDGERARARASAGTRD